MSITNNRFQLTFPDEWRETTTYTFEGPFDSGLQHNLVMTIVPGLPKETTLAGFARNQLAVSTESLPGFELIGEGEKQRPNGLVWYEAIYRYAPSDDIRFYQKQYFMLCDRQAYIFTSTFTKKTLKTFEFAIDAIVASLQPDP